MFGVIVTFAVVTRVFSNSLEGHLKPLGLQRKSEGHIEVTEDIPNSKIFFEEYIKGSKPIVFKGAAKKIPAFSLWTDDFLTKEFGHVQVDIEEGKKENRSLGAWTWPLNKFIENYKKDDVYMVHTLPKEMRRDLRLLPCISCGGYSKVLQMLVMWFSSGGTQSVLHNDGIDNINCLFSGSKSLYMVDWRHHNLVDFDSPGGDFSNVNVDAVDLDKYPGLAKAPWWEATMEAGDCLFIPYRWIHQVRSSADVETKRNMAVNIWFYHLNGINMSECEDNSNVNDFIPFDGLQVSNTNTEAVRFLLLLQLESSDEIERKEMLRKLFQYYQRNGDVSKIALKKVRGILDKNNDRKISVNEINDLTIDELKEISIVFPGLYTEEEGAPDEDTADEMLLEDPDEAVDSVGNSKDSNEAIDEMGGKEEL